MQLRCLSSGGTRSYETQRIAENPAFRSVPETADILAIVRSGRRPEGDSMTAFVAPEGTTTNGGAPGVHGSVPRGLTLPRNSPFFAGRFGRIFRALPEADYGPDDDHSRQALEQLGAEMVAAPDPQDPKDGPDNEEGGIPAAYTYLGQFIDHDLTFDPASSLQRQNDPDALVNFRTPRFDLDSVYGRGPADQPYLYDEKQLFLMGEALTGKALGRALSAN